MRSTTLGNRADLPGSQPAIDVGADAVVLPDGRPIDLAPVATPAVGAARRWLGRVADELTCTVALIVSVLPRGVLALTIAAMPVTRDYARPSGASAQKGDRASWRLITARRPMRLNDARTMTDLRAVLPVSARVLDGSSLELNAAVAPLVDAVVPGYPAAVVAVRRAQAAWDEPALRRLEALSREFDAERRLAVADATLAAFRVAARSGAQRGSPDADDGGAAIPELAAREASRAVQRLMPFRGVAVFDRAGRLLYPQSDAGGAAGLADGLLHRQMAEKARLTAAERAPAAATRWQGRCEDGLLIPFRVLRHGPAGGQECEVWFARTPLPSEFAAMAPADVADDPDTARLIPAMRHMAERFAQIPTLHDVARHAHLSPFHFHRRFSEAMGVTPKHFLLDCQVEHAQRELLLARKPLAQVAQACGFSHQSHFTSRFKQATGLTPIQWRKRAERLA